MKTFFLSLGYVIILYMYYTRLTHKLKYMIAIILVTVNMASLALTFTAVAAAGDYFFILFFVFQILLAETDVAEYSGVKVIDESSF